MSKENLWCLKRSLTVRITRCNHLVIGGLRKFEGNSLMSGSQMGPQRSSQRGTSDSIYVFLTPWKTVPDGSGSTGLESQLLGKARQEDLKFTASCATEKVQGQPGH